MDEKCTKLIFSLYKSANLNWGLQFVALKSIYIRAILPLLLYGAPIWYKTIDISSNKTQGHKSTKTHNYKTSKGIPNSIKRSPLRTDGPHTHHNKNTGGVSILPHHQRPGKRYKCLNKNGNTIQTTPRRNNNLIICMYYYTL